MKYQYFYQTSKNENRDGFIKAKNRADAFAKLRKQGIKPYRLKGDDPVNWQPWAIGAAFFAMVTAFFVIFFYGTVSFSNDVAPARRQQLAGDPAVVSKGLETGWEGVLPTCLDRYLAAYAQPGWIALPPDFTADQIAAFKDDLAVPLEFSESDNETTALLKKIVYTMRGEFKSYLDGGGAVDDYLKLLDERQDEEISARKRAFEAVESASPDMRGRVLMNANVRLREMGMAELEM